MAESDWDGWELLTRARCATRSSSSATTCSSPTPRSSREGIEKKIANAILIKPNQIGTLTETLAAIEMATKAGYSAVVSHRSGETEDATIADIAVATGATQIKTGSLCRVRSHREVQPAAAHRTRARRAREIRRRARVSGVALGAGERVGDLVSTAAEPRPRRGECES